MKSPVVLVGGAGYLGQHVTAHLANRGFDPVVVDPMVNGCFLDLGRYHVRIRDIRSLIDENDVPPGPIVYLASFHDLPFWDDLDLVDKRLWQEQAREIMVDVPLQLVAKGREVIYISSMRALTHPDTFYGNLKMIAEKTLFQKATILRFGTIWGGMNDEFYCRTITVPNNWAVRGELPDENWEAYLTPHVDACRAIEFYLTRLQQRQVVSVTRPFYPATARDLVSFVPQLDSVPERLRNPEPHPAYNIAAYCDLPLPKEDPCEPCQSPSSSDACSSEPDSPSEATCETATPTNAE